MKRMQHPKHGFHHAMNVAEEAAMRASGWSDDDGKDLERKLAAVAAPQGKENGVSPPGGLLAPVGAAPADANEVRAKLDALGIKYHPRLGLEKLRALLPQE